MVPTLTLDEAPLPLSRTHHRVFRGEVVLAVYQDRFCPKCIKTVRMVRCEAC